MAFDSPGMPNGGYNVDNPASEGNPSDSSNSPYKPSDEVQNDREWAEYMQNKQNEFSERMSSTAIQRQMEDLKKAGINPLMASQLMGSSSPQSGTGQQASTAQQAKELQQQQSQYNTDQAFGLLSTMMLLMFL